MKIIIIGIMTVCFLFGIVAVSMAKMNTATAEKTAPVPATITKKAEATPSIETFSGKIMAIDAAKKQIAIRQHKTNMFEIFIVNQKELSSLKMHEEVTVTFEKGSPVVKSLIVTKK